MGSVWRRWLLKNSEEISPWVGLAFGALYLAAIAAIGAAAIHVQQDDVAEQRVAGASRSAEWLARHLAHVRRESPEALAAEIRRAAREEGVAWCGLVSPEGVFAAHSDPDQAGKRAGALVAGDAAANGVQIAQDPARPAAKILIIKLPASAALRIAAPAGSTARREERGGMTGSAVLPANGSSLSVQHCSQSSGTRAGAPSAARSEELRVGLAPVTFAWSRSEILIWAGYVLPVVLGLYLACYRLLRRAVEPLAAIRRRLIGCPEPVAERLLALRLNDSFDQISSSWNGLIDFVGQMNEQLRHSKLSTDMSAAMDGFRSERLTNILMQLPFGVMVVDAQGSITFANRTATAMCGTAGESLEGCSAAEVLDESLRVSLLTGTGANKAGGAAPGRWTDYTFKRPHGDVTLRFWSLASEYGDGEHILFVQDITQAKEAERARDSFLYHVTHELRTPLTNIRAYAETLSQGVIDDEQTIRDCYNVIMSETQRLNRLVEDILNVSQLEVGSARLNLSEVPIDQLLRRVVQDMQGSADGKHLDLVLSLPAKAPRIRADRERLAVVLINLIGNAIKYTPEGGRVEIDCSPETASPGNERIRINVTDTGIGIAPEHQEKIFEKFYRVNDEKVQGVPGTGLGLAIVKETVRMHGGGIFVNSTPGKGSTFTLVLPALPLDGSSGLGTTAGKGNSTEEK